MKIEKIYELKYILIHPASVHILYSKYLREGDCPEEWHIRGRPPIVTVKNSTQFLFTLIIFFSIFLQHFFNISMLHTSLLQLDV